MVARSSAKVELRALAHGICKLLWLKILLDELKFMIIEIYENELMKVYYDNKAIIAISYNPVRHNKTKHVEVYRHFIKEKIERWVHCVVNMPSSQQVVDLFTKGSFKPIFEKLVDKLGPFNVFSLA